MRSNISHIQANVLAINSADDERNPPETGLLDQAMQRVKNGRLLLIPASAETRGHGTASMAKLWQQQLQEFVNAVPRRAM
jgi:homoserine O-acetyltransferase